MQAKIKFVVGASRSLVPVSEQDACPKVPPGRHKGTDTLR